MPDDRKPFHKQLRAQFMGSILGAFGLVVGLAWNDAIKSFIDSIFPIGSGNLPAKFIYAAILTVFVGGIIYLLSVWFMKED